MKKLMSLLTLSAVMTGCGVNASNHQPLPTVPAALSAPGAVVPAPKLGAATSDADAIKTPTLATPVVADRLTGAMASAKELASYGPLVTGLDTLQAATDAETHGYAVQTTPQRTQEAADRLARAWSSDAKQLWLAWGFKTFSLFGHSRHVYFSADKKRMLTIDFGFWGNKVDQYETTGLVAQYAGKLIAAFLQEPRDIYPVRGRDAYLIARRQGYAPTHGVAKVLMINPYIVGPQWVFLNAQNKPEVLVDANTGEFRNGGTLLQLLGYLF